MDPTSSSSGLKDLYLAAASVTNDCNDLPLAALPDTSSETRTVHVVLGFSFGVDNATALSSLTLSFAFSWGVKTFFGLPLACGLEATFFGFFAAFLVAVLLLGFEEVERAFVAVANVRRSIKETSAVDKAVSVFSRVLRRCKCHIFWNSWFVDGRTEPAPTLLIAALVIADSMMVKGAQAVC